VRPQLFHHERRIYFTFIMIVCDDKAIQKLLPQLLIVGDGLLTNDEFLTLQDEMPENMYLKRKKTGWNSSEVFSELMRLLREVLWSFRDATRFLISFDAVPLHIEKEVLRTIGDSVCFWFLLIPAKLTWLLQPLDVAVFSLLKRMIRRRFLDDVPHGDDKAVARMIRILIEVVPKLLYSDSWTGVFRRTGLWHNQTLVSNYIKKQLGIDAAPALPATRPSEACLALCWPSKRTVRYDDIKNALPVAAPPLLAIADGLADGPAALAGGRTPPAEPHDLVAAAVASTEELSFEGAWAGLSAAPAAPVPAVIAGAGPARYATPRRRLSWKQSVPASATAGADPPP